MSEPQTLWDYHLIWDKAPPGAPSQDAFDAWLAAAEKLGFHRGGYSTRTDRLMTFTEETEGSREAMSDPMSHVEHVYSTVLHMHLAARREDFHGEKAKKIFDLSNLLAEFFPEDIKLYEARFPGTSSVNLDTK